MKTKLASVMMDKMDSVTDILRPYAHLMLSRTMRSSAVYLIESGIFPKETITRRGLRWNRHYYRYRHAGPHLNRFFDFLQTCGSTYKGCRPVHVLLALSFTHTPEQLSLFLQSDDDIGLSCVAEGLISRICSSFSPFTSARKRDAAALSELSDSALRRLIVLSLSDVCKVQKEGAADGGSGDVNVASLHDSDSEEEDVAYADSEASSSSDASGSGAADVDAHARR
jgi:hypothetical protein